jgi:hypothetical protein
MAAAGGGQEPGDACARAADRTPQRHSAASKDGQPFQGLNESKPLSQQGLDSGSKLHALGS